MKKTAKKVLSLILCMILCMSLLPVSAFAENEEAAEENLTAAELPESNEELAVKEPAEEPAAEPEETSDGDANVAIDESSFPDAAFREYISANFDSDSDGQLSAEEIANVRSISCDGLGLTSLEGIALFQNLSILECNNNQLTELDVSQNPKLGVLSCMNNQLAKLDVSKNPELISLQCGTNQLTSLDVSQNPKLNWLSCWENQLTELDVSKNPELTSLQCGTNQLTELDVSQNPKLDIFSFWENQLTELDVSKNPELTSLQCGDNQLAELDVSQNPKLNTLSCGKNQLTELDVSKNPELTFLALFENQLTALDVSSNLKLTSLQLSSNQLTALDVSNSPALEVLLCHNNQLTALDLSNNPALISLGCSLNQLTELDLSNNPSLQYLSCSSNQLTALDVSGNPALETLYCIKNQLTVLDVSNNTNLQTFNCSEQSVTVPSFTQSGEKYIFDLSALVGAENTGKISSVENGDYDAETGIVSFDAASGFTYYYSTGYSEMLMDVCVTPEDTGEENIVASGTCGENLTWVLDNEGTLTISGTGTMEDYFDGAPWYDYRTDIISVVIESGVTSIGNWAFARSGMTNISLPEGLTLIGDLAFDGCSSLKSISFPASLSSIGTCLFQDCTNLEEILADGENTTFSSLNGVLFDREKTVLLAYPAGKAGEEYIVPDGVTGIGDYAFYRCGELKNITLPDSLTTIGEDAFFFCSNLTGVSFPGSVTSIALGAFFECSSLTEIGFAGDAPTFGEECFFGVTATAYYPADNETWTEAVMQNYGGTITWEEAPASTILYSGTCGENLTWTLDDAGLLTISGTGAMEDYSSGGSPWFDYRANIITLVIESGVTRVGTYAFEGCRNLTNISLPDCLTIIASYAFDSCRSLTNVTLPDSLTIIGSYTFWDCASLTDVRIPASVTSIGSGAFSGCSGLTSINIPDGVAHINPQTFASCKSITNIEIPDRVTSIGWNAFFDCSSLTNITIPGGVTGIGAWAFKDCTSLTEIIFKGDAPSIEASSFTNVTATAYYPLRNETWTEEAMQDYGGSLTWTAYDPGLPIDEASFPDAAFREYVTGFDSDGDGYFSAEELDAVTDISCNSKGIYDLTGIENFSRLRTLNCEWNYLENVDLSANTALEEVSLCANQLLSLNVNGLTALTSLNVGFYGYAFDDNGDPILDGPNVNKLTALDVSTNTALETLNCDANSLAALDVSGNNALTSLSCTNNKLEQLDLSANTGLLTLWVSGNPIETLDVSANTQLNFLACNGTLISSLDLHANTALTGLECVDCERLTGLDLSANTELTSLVTFWSKIERLDVSANTKLETLNCSEGNLEQIVGLSRLTNLSMLFCNVNHLTALDLSCFADKESFMFDCGGQTALVSAGAGLLADGSCRVNIADLVGAENTAKVSGVTALTRADGETPELISYDEATGAAVFTAAPESIVYNYDVGCNGKKMDVTAPVSLAAGYTLTGTAISWDGNGNELICLYSGLTEDEIEADIATGAAGARYTAQCNEAVQNADGQRYDVAFRFADVEAGEYILAIYKPGNYVLKTVNVTVSGDADLGELTLQLTGDVSGDGNVNTMDLIRLMKYISGVEVDMAEGAGDVNGDGKVNTMDLIRLMKLVNGEIV